VKCSGEPGDPSLDAELVRELLSTALSTGDCWLVAVAALFFLVMVADLVDIGLIDCRDLRKG
jgi:hypothetical protein